jgi:hypothetical protein
MNALRLLITSVALLAPAALIGCKSSGSSPTTQEATTQASQEGDKVYPPAPAGTPFAKIQTGMDQAQVTSLIGQPTDINVYVTGKAFIPFYYGGDTHRTMYHYKGQGRIIFSPDSRFTSGQSVIAIEYDPTETGFAH